MKPVVVGRYYIDGYIALYITKMLTNVTSIDCSEVRIISNYIFFK